MRLTLTETKGHRYTNTDKEATVEKKMRKITKHSKMSRATLLHGEKWRIKKLNATMNKTERWSGFVLDHDCNSIIIDWMSCAFFASQTEYWTSVWYVPIWATNPMQPLLKLSAIITIAWTLSKHCVLGYSFFLHFFVFKE